MTLILVAFLYVLSCGAQTVSTQAYNVQRTGWNSAETQIVEGNVGRLVSVGQFPVDAFIAAQPLVIENVSISGATRVLLTVTNYAVTGGGGTAYLFNADASGTPSPIWSRNLVTPITNSGQAGCVATPVVDTVAAVAYITCIDSGLKAWLYALNLADGTDFHARVQIACTYSGATFNAASQEIRPGLLLLGGQVYFGAGAGGPVSELTSGASGWAFEYNATTLAQTNCMTVGVNVVSGTGGGGIWASGVGFAVDSSGNIRFGSGNGGVDGTANFGESFLTMSPSLAIQNFFVPANWSTLNTNDLDLDSGGTMVIGTHAWGWGKDGRVWVDPTGGIQGAGGSFAQEFATGLGSSTDARANVAGAFCAGTAYLSGPGPDADTGMPITAYAWSGSTFNTAPIATSAAVYPAKSARLACTSNGAVPAPGSQILWGITSPAVVQLQTPVYLQAFDPATLAILYTSPSFGFGSTFAMPTISSGRVYLPTRSGYIAVYGLAASCASCGSRAGGGSSGWSGGIF